MYCQRKQMIIILLLTLLLTACGNKADTDTLEATLTIDCSTVLENMDNLKAEKREIIPEEGILYHEDVTFKNGQSAFELLQQETKANKIHMEFEQSTSFNTYFIKGIGNLYALDCGDLSGWYYKVNGEFPEIGSESYRLQESDHVEFIYSCNMGIDIGLNFD